jgi:hypothetical protein
LPRASSNQLLVHGGEVLGQVERECVPTRDLGTDIAEHDRAAAQQVVEREEGAGGVRQAEHRRLLTDSDGSAGLSGLLQPPGGVIDDRQDVRREAIAVGLQAGLQLVGEGHGISLVLCVGRIGAESGEQGGQRAA